MKSYNDTDDIKEIKQTSELGVLNGFTTNPLSVSMVSGKFEEAIQSIGEAVKGQVIVLPAPIIKITIEQPVFFTLKAPQNEKFNQPKKVFISYAHADKNWRLKLSKPLKVLEEQGALITWDDQHIRAGDDWSKKIINKIDESDLAILLISSDFLSSDFIMKKEIPRLLYRKHKDALHMVPILVESCQWKVVRWLKKLQILPKGARALSTLKKPQRELEINEIVNEIIQILKSNKTKVKRDNEILY